jgi:hypothetical protein
MEHEDVEKLQQQYLDAINSGNQEDKERIEKEIDSRLAGSEPTETVDTPPETPEGEQEEGVAAEASAEQEVPEGQAKDGPVYDDETQSWLNSLDASVRKHVEGKLQADKKQLALELYKREQAEKSNNGRVAAYQSRYQELQNKTVQLEEMLQKHRKPQEPAAPQKKTKTIEEDPDLKQIAETDPELARVFLAREQEMERRLAEMDERFRNELEPLRRSSEDQVVNNELAKLEAIVPNYREIFNYRTPEGLNVWEAWVSEQSQGVQQLALSDHANDVVRALELYGADIQRMYPEETPKEPNAKAQSISQERERKLSAVPVGSNAVRPPQKTKPTDEEIAANPALLEKEHERLLNEYRKQMGY